MAEFNLHTLVSLQVQPIRPFLQGMARHIRTLAASLNKEVEVVVQPTDCRVDRRIVEALKGAMLHLVANAVDHGLEEPRERRLAGKTPRGRIEIGAEARADRVRIVVVDDGRGIDASRVLETAVAKGLMSSSEGCPDRDEKALQLLFTPGFTTRQTATEVSGRGVGLDAVDAAVRSAGGSIWLSSEPGRGTRVTVDLPTVKRGEVVVVVEVSGAKVAIPAAVVTGYSRLAEKGGLQESTDGSDHVPNGFAAGFIDVGAALGRRGDRPRTALTISRPGLPPGLLVDRVVTEEEVLIRPWPSGIGVVWPFEGFALLATGRPIAVLDLRRIIERPAAPGANRQPAHVQAPRSAIRVLLVDDSRVTREMLRRLLVDSGFDVVAVGSGQEALHHLAKSAVDCLVTDIEMDGIDGLELTRRVRSSTDHAHLPVIVVSTRGRTMDRLAGLDAGADAYLTKQKLNSKELASLVRRLGRND